MPQDSDDGPRDPYARVFWRGLRVIGVAMRTEPLVGGAAILGSAVHAAAGVGASYALGYLTDAVILPSFASGSYTTAMLATAAGLLLGIGVLRSGGIAARRLLAGLHMFRMQARYRRDVARSYLRLPLSWHQRHPTGQLLSNANADVEATWQPLAPLAMAVGSVFMLLIAGVAMVVTDWVLALVGFVVFPAVAAVNVVFQRRLTPAATRAQSLRGHVSEVAHESFDGALVVKTLGREDTETERFTAAAHELRDAQIRLGRIRGLFDPIIDALPNLGVLAVLLVGTHRLAGGAIGPGELVQVAYLFTMLAMPVRSFGWLLGELPRSVVGWERVRSVLTARGDMHYGAATLPGAGGATVDVRDVSFSYADSYTGEAPGTVGGTRDLTPTTGDSADDAGRRTTVLHDVNLTVAPGRTVALVGPTGSGKSTLVALLVRLADPDRGTVALDGVEARDLAHGEIARAAALVPQGTFVFDDTVRGNITLGADIADERVWAALRTAHADDFVTELPDGLDTELGERGTSLSGGQRQRIALARALVRAPRLLVLDDATSAVDPQVEARILSRLRDRDDGTGGTTGGTTTVVVAYRRATIELADEVIYLEEGTVRDQGTHAELLARSPGYAELVTAYERAAREQDAANQDTADDASEVAR